MCGSDTEYEDPDGGVASRIILITTVALRRYGDKWTVSAASCPVQRQLPIPTLRLTQKAGDPDLDGPGGSAIVAFSDSRH